MQETMEEVGVEECRKPWRKFVIFFDDNNNITNFSKKNK